MPKYHFHTADDGSTPDTEGVELPDAEAAKVQAVKFAGEVLSHYPSKLYDGNQFRVAVSGDDGALLFTIVVLSVEPTQHVRVGS